MTKTCKTCHIEKPVSEFYKQTMRSVFGVRGSCKACDNQKKKEYRARLGQELSARKKQEYAKNRDARLKQKRDYRQANKGKINALVALRKKLIKQRTPIWLTEDDKWMMKEAYELAALRTKMFGFSWHVDHIVPLQGKAVSGLHVPTNLQVIPWLDNIRKKNKVADHGRA
jgi:hypothetical protein